jgi:hypothetical protein
MTITICPTFLHRTLAEDLSSKYSKRSEQKMPIIDTAHTREYWISMAVVYGYLNDIGHRASIKSSQPEIMYLDKVPVTLSSRKTLLSSNDIMRVGINIDRIVEGSQVIIFCRVCESTRAVHIVGWIPMGEFLEKSDVSCASPYGRTIEIDKLYPMYDYGNIKKQGQDSEEGR